MRHAGVDLHNVEALTETDTDGRRLDRLSPELRADVNENAREMYTWAAGTEVRFVCDGSATVTLSCPTGECTVVPHYGSFAADPAEWETLGPEPTALELDAPDGLHAIDADRRAEMAFDPAVVRLCLQGEPVHLHDVAGDVRPPHEAELPDRTLLTYGTSITQGLLASAGHHTYAARTARRLGTDLVNLGTSGSAHCERVIADHVADRDDWDVGVLSISVNMLANGFTPAEFRKRAAYMVDAVAGGERPVACVTLYPLFTDVRDEDAPEEWGGSTAAYRETLRDVVAESPHDDLHLVEGPDLLTDVTGLSPDLVHPSDYGMGEIGARLADRLADLAD
ncbi:MAG: SGNH/GDSL hydrolase family protein [Halobacteriaceae archaeon]